MKQVFENLYCGSEEDLYNRVIMHKIDYTQKWNY